MIAEAQVNSAVAARQLRIASAVRVAVQETAAVLSKASIAVAAQRAAPASAAAPVGVASAAALGVEVGEEAEEAADKYVVSEVGFRMKT